MLMDSFEVENFRSLKHLKLEKLARVNLLVGKNNSGKTSVLEGLLALVGAGGGTWLSFIERERGLTGNASDFRYLFYGFDADRSIRLFSTHRDIISTIASPMASLSVTITAQNQSNAQEDELRFQGSLFAPPHKHSAEALLVTMQLPSRTESLDFEISRTARSLRYNVLASEETSVALARGVFFPASARHKISEILTTTIDRKTLNQKIENLKFNKRDQQLLQTLQIVDPRIKEIVLGSGQIYLDLGENFLTLLPLNLMGEGIQRLLDVISAVAHTAGGVLLIDEIDNGLHYSALRILWRGILQAARRYDVQVFATTHSAEALRHLTWVLDDEENASYRDDVAVYTLIRAKDDTVHSYRYDYEQLDFAMEHDMEVRN